MSIPAYVSVSKAAERLDMTPEAFGEWVRRWNRENPDRLIRRMHGRVRQDDLVAALEIEESEFRNKDLSLEEVSHGN
jgi:transposase-like protein